MRLLGATRQTPALVQTLVGLAVAAAVLTGCGDDGGEVATDEPTASETVSASPEAGGGEATDPACGGDDGDAGCVDSDEVAILSATAAGGSVSETAVALKDDTAVQEFAGQFKDATLGDEIASTVAQTDVPVGRALYGAVIAVGCDVPPGVVVSSSDEGVTITAQKVTAPKVECFAPVTSVGLVLVAD